MDARARLETPVQRLFQQDWCPLKSVGVGSHRSSRAQQLKCRFGDTTPWFLGGSPLSTESLTPPPRCQRSSNGPNARVRFRRRPRCIQDETTRLTARIGPRDSRPRRCHRVAPETQVRKVNQVPASASTLVPPPIARTCHSKVMRRSRREVRAEVPLMVVHVPSHSPLMIASTHTS